MAEKVPEHDALRQRLDGRFKHFALLFSGTPVPNSNTESWPQRSLNLESQYVEQQRFFHEFSPPGVSEYDATSSSDHTDPSDPGWPSLWRNEADEQNTNKWREVTAAKTWTPFHKSLEVQAKAQDWKTKDTNRESYSVQKLATLDYDLIERWLGTCRDLHRCSDEPDAPIKTLAVDCNEMRLVEIGTDEKYLALSYVWGRTPAFKLTAATVNELCLPDSLKRVTSLSRTVEDAIEFTRKVGGRYLWVDRLCIVQDQDQHRYNAISLMHKIYRHAWAVIIAGSGANADAGLPRIRPNDREAGPSIDSRESTNLEETLAGTCYESRAWTYQERLLARRRIIFFNNYVLFQCPTTTVRDDIRAHNDGELVDVRSMRNFEGGMSIEDFKEPMNAYRNTVHKFCTREMTDDKDVLNAFVGVLNALGPQLGTRMVFGLPEEHLVDALCWRFTESAMSKVGRRHGFPSWSWCGWNAAIVMPYLPKGNAQPSQDESKHSSSVIFGDYTLKLPTILASFYIGQPDIQRGDATPTFAEFKVIDKNGTACGYIQLPYVRKDLVGTQQKFLILKEAARFEGLASAQHIEFAVAYNQAHEPTQDEWESSLDPNEMMRYIAMPLLIVLMLDKTKTGSWERAGVGYIYRRAIFQSHECKFDDEFVLS